MEGQKGEDKSSFRGVHRPGVGWGEYAPAGRTGGNATSRAGEGAEDWCRCRSIRPVLSGDPTYGIKHHAVGYPFSYRRVLDGKVVSTEWIDVGAIP